MLHLKVLKRDEGAWIVINVDQTGKFMSSDRSHWKRSM